MKHVEYRQLSDLSNVQIMELLFKKIALFSCSVRRAPILVSTFYSWIEEKKLWMFTKLLLQYLNWDKNSLHISPWWSKASCSIWHLINVFNCNAMPFSVSENGVRKGSNLRQQSPMQSFSDSKINKTTHPNRPHRETNDYNYLLKLLFNTMTTTTHIII